jgi:hypothetical protein
MDREGLWFDMLTTWASPKNYRCHRKPLADLEGPQSITNPC